MAINVLDSVIYNRISAGEVVEKPASVVKELLDNALDAKADNIIIEIRKGGIDYISIIDNGCGIQPEDVKKAFLPHATSKISNLEDLDNIATLGFRGEALASIASVSQTTITTKTSNLDYATKLSVNGGDFGAVSVVGSNNGTTIEVNNLFYNTPARRKFLRKPKSEENEITNVISRYILANPKVKIKYIADNKTIFNSKGTNLLDAISCVYGDDVTQNLLPINYSNNEISLEGFVGKVSFTKPNTTYQTLLINGRYVIDEGLSKAVYMAYEEFLMSRQFPFFVINLTMPYSEVDVNVHPSKINVKFANPSQMFDIFYRATRQAIYNSINPVSEKFENTESLNNYGSQFFMNNVTKQDYKVIEQPTWLDHVNNNLDKDIEPQLSNKLVGDSADVLSSNQLPTPSKEEVEITPVNPIYYDKHNSVGEIRLEKYIPQQNISMFDDNFELKSSEENPAYQNINNFSDYKVIGEVFNEFLILEKGEVLLFVDFHAGHERLLYDKLVERINTNSLDIQSLLVPYYHTLNIQEMEYINNLIEPLTKLGFEIEQFGPNEIRICSLPLILSDINLKQFIDDLLHDMNNQRPKINEELDRMLMQKACKSAVKSGMVLNDTQIKQLLKNLDVNRPVLLCPHGRPIVSVVKRSQIEKWFKRIV